MVSRRLGSEPVDVVQVLSDDGVAIMSNSEAAESVLAVVKRGGLAVVPFDVSYAFLAGTLEPLRRIYELKLRPVAKPCPILASWEHFVDVAAEDHKDIQHVKGVVDAGLPVGVLARVNWESSIIRSIPDACIDILVKEGKVALFMNMGGLSGDLLRAADRDGVHLFGSSANISGKGNSFELPEVPESMLDAVDIICEAGRCKYANKERLASSIIDVQVGKLTRHGILHADIEKLLTNSDRESHSDSTIQSVD